MYFNIVFAFLALSTSVYAQATSSGTCPSVRGQEGFVLEKFLGPWYLHAAYPNTVTEGECVSVVYSGYVNGSFNDYVAKYVDGELTYLVGNFVPTEEDPGIVVGALNGDSITATIVNTDYLGYVFIYSCEQTSETEKQEVVWILTRDWPLSDSSQAAVSEYIAANDYIQSDKLVLASYDSCGII